MAMEHYYYDGQFKRYIVQFMEIFNGMKVRTGKRDDGEIREMSCPVTYGSRDRVTAALMAQNTQNNAIRLPAMSAFVRNINLAPEMRKGIGVERRQSFLPTGGMIPNDIRVVKQVMPVPYKMDMELAIYTSNTDQHLQVMEQILMFFDPILQIQTSDETFDWTKISTVELTGINFDENYPTSTDSRMIQTTLSFEIPIYVAGPTNLKKEFVQDVYARIQVGSDLSEMVSTVEGALDEEYYPTGRQNFTIDEVEV